MDPSRSTAFDDSEFDDPRFDDPAFRLDDPAFRLGEAGLPSREDRTAAVMAHASFFVGLGVLAPLVIYLVKKDTSAFVADQAREALNFHLTVTLAVVAAVASMVVLVGFVLLPALLLGASVLAVVATVRANDGEAYRYPFTIRLVR